MPKQKRKLKSARTSPVSLRSTTRSQDPVRGSSGRVVSEVAVEEVEEEVGESLSSSSGYGHIREDIATASSSSVARASDAQLDELSDQVLQRFPGSSSLHVGQKPKTKKKT